MHKIEINWRNLWKIYSSLIVMVIMIAYPLLDLQGALKKKGPNKKSHKSKKSIPSWIFQGIDADFSLFKNRIEQKNLETVWEICSEPAYEGHLFTRCQFLNDSIVLISPVPNHPRVDLLVKGLDKLRSTHKVPSADFIVCLGDSTYDKGGELPFFEHYGVPLLVLSKHKGNKNEVLIPDCDALSGYKVVNEAVELGDSSYPWKKKKSLIFWRGSTTGGGFGGEDWIHYGRSRLVLLSLNYPHLVNARFTSLCQGAEHNPDILMRPELCDGWISIQEQLQYKYLIDVDGNSAAWSRFYWTLLSQSVVFKQITDNEEWFYKALSPYVHYIPVAEDFSDLLEKIEWAKENEDEVQKIARNGTEFAAHHLSEEMIYTYLYYVIKRYAELQ